MPARKALTRLVLPGQRRLHFTKEADSRRRQILAAIAGLPVEVVIFDGSAHRTARDQRSACLAGRVCELAGRGARRMVLELDDSIIDADRRVLYQAVRGVGCADSLHYEHHPAGEEPLLAVPDAVAWCWAACGGIGRGRSN